MTKKEKNIFWFKELGINDVALVGGKNASLGEMYVRLVEKGVVVPNGFATSSGAYFDFLKSAKLDGKIKKILQGLQVSQLHNLQQKGRLARNLILSSKLPEEFQKEIRSAYKELSKEYNAENVDVAVRSSATAEDLPNASFAGQQETFLNVSGADRVVEAVKKCFASLFTDRAIAYRQEMGFDHLKVGLSAGVQKMVRADLASSGVMFSCDTESGFGKIILINASWGLGENVVQGTVEPDQYYVFETTLKSGFKPIVEKRIGSKKWKMVYSKNSLKPVKNIATIKKERNAFVLTNEEILTLARWSMAIEEYYKKEMDIEWAKDGKDGMLYIVQARPETVKSRKKINVLEEYVLSKTKTAKVLAEGLSVGSKIGSGKANTIRSAKEIRKFKKGQVLITGMTDPDWVPAMKMASAIVTDSGGRTAHAAIVSRELGIPCIVGTKNATKNIKTGEQVTVDCSQGERGVVYQGIIHFKVKRTDVSGIKKTKTNIMMNLGDPGQAFQLSFIPNDGVGLCREEFIIANAIKIHPRALIDYKTLSPSMRKKIDALSMGYENKIDFYIDKLSEGIGKIGAAFYPKPVIVRFSDFKTNEYRQLLGGELYEQEEENPMMGLRGASRYYHETFKDAFVLECKAIKKVREEFGLENVRVMIPFCRTIQEGRKVLQIMEENGLACKNTSLNVRSDDKSKRQLICDSLKVYVMCEVPSNVVLAEEFLEIFDGFSIGSNDLSQLTLGLDRDNAAIAHIGNEKNEAVKKMIAKVVKACKEKGKYSGLCGQGPSDFSDFAEFLVEQGIESISLNPDSIIKTTLLILEKEKNV